MAGYSKTPTWKKLGIKEGMGVIHLHAPENYAQILGELPQGAILQNKLRKNAAFIHYFTKEKSSLSDDFAKLKEALLADGTLWISWPKGASKAPTDLNENIIRDIGLRNGLVDVKVAAVDETWLPAPPVRFSIERPEIIQTLIRRTHVSSGVELRVRQSNSPYLETDV